MQITDIALGLGGNPAYRKFTITYQDLQTLAAATTGSVSLSNAFGANAPIQPIVTTQTNTAQLLAQAAKILGVYVHQTVQFAGAGPVTALTVSVGNSISATQFTTAFNIFAAPADTTGQETAMFKSGQLSGNVVSAFFTATGGNINGMTAGSVDIYVWYLDVSTAGA